MPASLSNTSSSSRVPATGIGVRRANRNDLPAIARLEQDSFTTDRMSERQWRRHLDSPSAEVQVAIRDRRVVGAALVFYRRRSNLARVYSIAVAAAQRGVGIGALLLDAVEQSARQRGLRRLRLEVRVDNVAAKRLYEQRGFTAFGVHTAYYEDGTDATRYQKALAETT